MSERFYTNCLLQPGPVELTGPEAHHLATVCRLRPGDAVCLFNGDGHEYPAQVQSVGKRSVVLDVSGQETPSRELPFTLQVAAPLPKGDRAQYLVEKLTELGVNSFIPLSTQRSVVQPREAKLEKMQRYVIEASKQCGRNVLMKVESLVDWETYCRQENLGELKLLAHPVPKPTGDNLATPSHRESLEPISAAVVTLAVGPEGGFTEEEVLKGQQAGWKLIGLGTRILRVETAALVLAAWVVAWHR